MDILTTDLAKNSEDPKVKNILQVYRLHLQNHALDDDSNGISIKDLYRYVEEEIDDEDKAWYGHPDFPNRA